MYLERLLEFVASLGPRDLFFYFWPFFLIDLVRYTLLDLLVLGAYMPGRHLRQRRIQEARSRLFRERPLVSVIAPGKNEGRHIPALADSLDRQTYRHLEIIIVDDGSDDETPAICRQLERRGRIRRFIRNEVRGGKASAANTALRYCRGRFVVHLDADSSLRYDSIERILIPFYLHHDVGAVGGDIRVDNLTDSMATRMQGVEYIKAITTGRTVSSMLGILRIVAGAYGAFRRDVLERLGGWDVGPGLDGDITLKIRKLGLRIVHEPEAVCYTNVPDSFRKLARQRFRWDRSMVRFRMRKHVDLLKPGASFHLRNFIASFENIFFSILLNIKWWVYLAQMLVFHPEMLSLLLPINYVLYFTVNVVQFAIAVTAFRSSLRTRDIALALYLPAVPLYIGVYLRLVRTLAQLMELLHKVSYRDRWNPWKVSSIARREGL